MIDDPNVRSARRLQPNIEIPVLKEWIDFCDTNHKALCHKITLETSPGFRTIDCSTRRLVLWGTLARLKYYLTLSYVWGGVHDPRITDIPNPDDNLPTDLPQTIEDTISRTLRLGHRYLWIDRCCIPQDDLPTKQAQIQGMDSIYRGRLPCGFSYVRDRFGELKGWTRGQVRVG